MDVEGIGEAHQEVEERAVVDGVGDLGVGPPGLTQPLDLFVGAGVGVAPWRCFNQTALSSARAGSEPILYLCVAEGLC